MDIKRITTFLVALLLIIYLSGTCFADTSLEKIGSISTSVFTDDEWKPVHKESGCAHLMDGFYGDGILAFSSLGNCFAMGLGNDLPEYVLDADFVFKAVVDKPFDERTSIIFNVYTEDDGKLNKTEYRLKAETSEQGEWLIDDWTELDDGRYVIEAAYKVSQDEYYYWGSALFWLQVGESLERS